MCCEIGPSRGVAQFGCIGMMVGLSRGAAPLSSMASYCGTATLLSFICFVKCNHYSVIFSKQDR